MRSHYYDDATWKRPDPVASGGPSRAGTPSGEPASGFVPFTAGESRPAPVPARPAQAGDRRRTPDVREGRQGRGRGRHAGLWIFLCCFALLTGAVAGSFALKNSLDRSQQGTGDLPGRESDPAWPFGDDWGFSQTEDWTELLEDTDLPAFPVGGELALELREEMGEALAPVRIYEQVNPSVVGVRTVGAGGMSTGTGVILSQDGYIVTNAHVIAGGRQVEILFPNNYLMMATLVGYDGGTDLAVLKINAHDLPAAQFGDSDLLRVGDLAYAIGNPLGEELRGTMTDGIISAIDRPVSALNGDMTLLQTTAALNPGNSGGALVNAAGEVIGITNMKMMAEGETIEGLGFAIPSTLVKDVVEQLIATGHYPGRPMLGVTVTNHFDGDNTPDGAEVVSVERTSDAYGQGLRTGHVIIAANGAPVSCVDDLQRAKRGLRVGDTLTLTLDGEEPWAITVTLQSDRA